MLPRPPLDRHPHKCASAVAHTRPRTLLPLRLSATTLAIVLFALLLPLSSHAREGKAAADFYISSIPGVDGSVSDKLDQYAGHLPTTPDKNHSIYFWLVTSRTLFDTNNLIIWLNGGPGCSSMDGLFLEVGPWRIQGNGTIRNNEFSWNQKASLLFIDQPAGTGFSYATPPTNKIPTSEQLVADDLLAFLNNFFAVFPQYRKQKLYIAGESWAGTYIPYIAREMLKRNKDPVDKRPLQDMTYNLNGLMIGNGWIDPQRQYSATFDYAVAHSLVTGQNRDNSALALTVCLEQFTKYGERLKYQACERLADYVENESREGGKVCLNIYDIRLRDEACGMGWPEGIGKMKELLNNPSFVKAINAEGVSGRWDECSDEVWKALNGDTSEPPYLFLPDLLKEVPIMLFSGDKDFICNHMGTEYMIGNMTWGDVKGWGANITTQAIALDGKVRGSWTSARNLTYALVREASHMVPVDAPDVMLALVNTFMGVEDMFSQKGGDSLKSGTDITNNSNKDGSGSRSVTQKLAEATGSSEAGATGAVALILVGSVALCVAVVWFRNRKYERLGQYKRGSDLRLDIPDMETSQLANNNNSNGHTTISVPSPPARRTWNEIAALRSPSSEEED